MSKPTVDDHVRFVLVYGTLIALAAWYDLFRVV